VADGRRHGQRAGQQGVGVGADLLAALLDELVELDRVDAQRPVRQPGERLVDALGRLVGQVAEPGGDGAAGDDDEPGDGRA